MIESISKNMQPVSIEEIKDLCFSVPLRNQDLHSALLERLADFFIYKGFIAEREWQVGFTHYHKTWNMALERKGFIDLVATDGQRKIAVEFDTGNTLKRRSIEKLLDCDAGVVIGIAGTGCSAPKLRENIKKVYDASSYTKHENKVMWIVLLGKKVAEEIIL